MSEVTAEQLRDPAIQARFWPKVDASGDCWEWTGVTNSSGYGQFAVKHHDMRVVHRVAYSILVGLPYDELTLDHLCRNRICVNPDHLQPVTERENILRGYSPSAQHARKTHCLRGHPFSGDNLRIDKYGRRLCKTCRRMRAKRYRDGR